MPSRGKKMLVLLTASLYVPGTLDDADNVLIDVGTGYFIEVKKRRNDDKQPVKYMGCGDCENLSHSITDPMASDGADVLQRITGKLFGSFHIDVKEI